MRPFRLALVAVILIALVIWVVIPQASAAVTVSWNQSDPSTVLTRWMDEDYQFIADPDFNLTAPWSQMGRVTIDGQTMVHVPRFWYRTDNVTINGFHYLNYSISATPLSGYSVHPWFIINGTSVPAQYIGAFEGSMYNVATASYVGDPASVNAQPGGDLLSSVAGQKPTSGVGKASLTLPGFRNTSQSRGVGWELQSFNGISAVQLLYIVEKGNWDSQSVIGTGVTQILSGAGNMAIPTGLTAGSGTNSIDCGNYTCSVVTVHYSTGQNTNQVSYRGVEAIFGNIWKWVDGINIKADRTPWVANYSYASDVFAEPYSNTGLSLAAAHGYQTDLGYKTKFDYGFLPLTVGGSASTYIPDYYFQSTGNRAALLGGSWSGGAGAGAFELGVADVASAVGREIGARAAFTPPVVANFTHTNTSAIFTFTDESFTISTRTGLAGSPSAWNWSFGDGHVSTEQNPTHTYAAAGTYTVNLTVSDGTNAATKIESVTLGTFPLAKFTPAGPQVRVMPAWMKWNQTSTNGPVSCLWQFGDGTSSTVCNVSHKYPMPGDYPVQFTATNAAGSSTNTTRIRVMMR